MTGSADTQTRAKERLSAIMDGEADDASVRLACLDWRDQPGVASTWRDYQLIGDVLRSDDLATDAGHDAAFLEAFRARLTTEPVVIAPASADAGATAPEPLRADRRWWRTASVVAAGFFAVVGVLVVTRAPDPSLSAAPADIAAAGSGGVVRASAAGGLGTALPGTDVQTVEVANGKLIRDARLDHYLKAHKQFSGTAALGAPSAFMRSATSDASNR
jgi:sigma-E factor negative regulatory protein RseA